MKQLKYCNQCKWAVLDTDPYYKLTCSNPHVNANDPWALSRMTIKGKDCSDARNQGNGFVANFFATCGIKGKLWEQKSELANASQI